MTNPIIQQIEQAKEEMDTKISMLAQQYKESTIDPICKKYNLTFVAGMGLFSFTSEDFDLMILDADVVDYDIEELKEIHEDDLYEIEKLVLKYPSIGDDMVSVFEVLNTEIYNFVFGYYY